MNPTKQTKDGKFEYRDGQWVPYEPSKSSDINMGPDIVIQVGGKSVRPSGSGPHDLSEVAQAWNDGRLRGLQEIRSIRDAAFGDAMFCKAAHDGLVPCAQTPQFKTFERGMERRIEDAFEGAWKKNELSPPVERLLRQGKGAVVERAARFLARLESLKQSRGSNRKFPISENSGFARSEIRRRGFWDGVEAVQALLGKRIDANNGHEMKWFPPRDLA